jgi:hypothetical protein
MHSTALEPSLETKEVQIPFRDEGSVTTLNTLEPFSDDSFSGDRKHTLAIGYNPINNVRTPIKIIREMTP